MHENNFFPGGDVLPSALSDDELNFGFLVMLGRN